MLQVLIAAAAGYAFGAVWYTALAKPWVKATGIEVDTDGRPANKSPLPFISAFISALFVAGMMRHIFTMAGIDTAAKGLVTGLGLGVFIVAPWMVNNVMFGHRDKNLIWIDGGYAAGGCTVIGLVLALF